MVGHGHDCEGVLLEVSSHFTPECPKQPRGILRGAVILFGAIQGAADIDNDSLLILLMLGEYDPESA